MSPVLPRQSNSDLPLGAVVDDKSADFFRCPIQDGSREAFLRASRRRCKVQVHETSIDGFTVLVSAKEARKLKVGETWVLEYDDTRFEVLGQWFFNSPDGRVQLGLRRLRDLTPIPTIRQSFFSRFGSGKTAASATSASGFGGFIIVLFLAMALPGLGEQLGTADRIQGTVQWIYLELGTMLGR